MDRPVPCYHDHLAAASSVIIRRRTVIPAEFDATQQRTLPDERFQAIGVHRVLDAHEDSVARHRRLQLSLGARAVRRQRHECQTEFAAIRIVCGRWWHTRSHKALGRWFHAPARVSQSRVVAQCRCRPRRKLL